MSAIIYTALQTQTLLKYINIKIYINMEVCMFQQNNTLQSDRSDIKCFLLGSL